MSEFNRRHVLKAGGSTALALGPLAGLWLASSAEAQQIDTLTIAYNVGLPSWDPTTGPSAVNPSIQGIWKAVFDQYIEQAPDLSFKPGLITKWGWNADKTKIEMELRPGVLWHDGTPLTAGRRGLEPEARRRPQGRQSGRPASSGRASTTSRSRATRSPPTSSNMLPTTSSGWPSSPAS